MKNTIYNILLVLLGYTCTTIQAQNVQQEYLNGKSLFKSEKYALAMETFKPIIQKNSSKQIVPYASFYYALAAYRQQYLTLARDMFLQINKRFPKWKNKVEVDYWLSKLYLEQGNFLAANKYPEGKSLSAENANQKRYYFSKIKNIDSLIVLQEQMPKDENLAYVLAKTISRQMPIDQDRNLFFRLVKDFNLNEEEFTITRVNPSVKKQVYRVAVIMPFMLDQLSTSLRKKTNQFVYDLYEGMQLAVQHLKKKGVKIHLYAYDTKKNIRVTKAILKKDELKTMDLIIGPLFPKPSREVSNFSYRYNINMINPLSANQQVIENNPYSFLYHPQYRTQAKAAANYVIKNITNKNSIIFYGRSIADSIKAFTYKQKIERNSFKVLKMSKVSKNNSQYIQNMLTATFEIEEEGNEEEMQKKTEQLVIPKGSIGSIYVASVHQLIASGVVSSVEIRGDFIPVIGSEKWLDYKFTDYSAYERLGVILVAPNYIVNKNATHRYINNHFINKYAVPASKHAYYGYDLMIFTGQSLHKYGTYFQQTLYKKSFTKGTLTSGYSYLNANDNQYVPLLQFKDGAIEVINKPRTSTKK